MHRANLKTKYFDRECPASGTGWESSLINTGTILNTFYPIRLLASAEITGEPMRKFKINGR